MSELLKNSSDVVFLWARPLKLSHRRTSVLLQMQIKKIIFIKISCDGN